jgi:hypothetical protein
MHVQEPAHGRMLQPTVLQRRAAPSPHQCTEQLLVVIRSWVAWASAGHVATHACSTTPDVRAAPPCRALHRNSLSGTLPEEWGAMTSMQNL